ncbi:peptidoglycan DD-metalloendopeptidase family protein [Thermoactinomyces sp. DSM 45892]|uniref:peptidoglycan DD-metalloendopeptidase family protein n=1 Tax=Thermoactinomyces sp. DSM 45892 TaxID=1882753 RepID=UPI0008998347|nr:peptidoglycan DD-metalloendopeptidase family protein [Thermoactinomyces sp. DSM 45892]SDY82746.1 Murein DD-endopeptidase MepM and murein hydrolase activator NlpD, contain LysM domain [Thermoactinomyces sp. DSM 45892]
MSTTMSNKKKGKGKKFLLALVCAGIVVFLMVAMLFFVMLSGMGTNLLQQQKSNTDLEWVLSPDGKKLIPAQYIPIYQEAGKKYGVPWPLLAAIHKVETDFSRNLSVSYTGARGHFQFQPCTWVGWSYSGCKGTLGNLPNSVDITNTALIAKHGGFGVDANGDGKADPYDIHDAVHSAARYLFSNHQKGEDWFGPKGPVWNYNHAQFYIDKVQRYTNLFASAQQSESGGATYTGGKFVWPVKGRITGVFGEWRGSHSHGGLDIAAPLGTPIYAAADGVVYLSKANPGGYGWYVGIDHGGGVVTWYGHVYQHQVIVKVGDKVKQGQKIAVVGNNGRSSGPHLHLEVHVKGQKQDPLKWLNK